MPYLHFETNEGRIRLSNAIKRSYDEALITKSRNKAKTSLSSDDTDTLEIADVDSPVERSETASFLDVTSMATNTRLLFSDDEVSSDSEAEGNYVKRKTEHKVNQIKG